MNAGPASESLFPSYQPDSTIAWWRKEAVSHPQFMDSVLGFAGRLPERAFAINLCESRFLFLAAFTAVVSRRQTNLLPTNKMAEEVLAVAAEHPDCYCIVEKKIPGLALEQVVCEISPPENPAAVSIPRIPKEHVAAIAFTSGTTGRPSANPKTWDSLVTGAALWRSAFWGERPGQPGIVATVPPQHMYGLETTILVSLAAGVSIHGGQPFLPKNIRDVLEELPPPRVLVSTPIHLNACAEASLTWPDVEMIISATAPFPLELAARVEKAFETQVLEIYGCTEAGSLARRRTLDGEVWRTYEGVKLNSEDGVVMAAGGHLVAPVPLQDNIELESETAFRLVGRKADMVNIAGKRGSLGNLNQKLKAIEGVDDGVFITPEESEGETGRLAALVVAPGLSEERILAELRRRIEPAFLPRPLYLVDALPYNGVGKLPRRTLLARIRRGNAKKT